MNAVAWKKILEKSDYHFRVGDCLAGFGLSIFGKYIPGKIWMVMGRAAYIAEKSEVSLGALSAVSLNMQFIAIWIGLVFGLLGMLLLEGCRPGRQFQSCRGSWFIGHCGPSVFACW